jgi:ring-1,2-phenylacetyl-CoA epoxidase subunit PaaE
VSERPTATRRGFHTLTVARVERLCDDAVAVTFDVPADLAEQYRFAPGQSLTLRRMLEGRDERRTYSICAAAGEPLRIGVRTVPGGLFSSWLVGEVTAGDAIEVQPPSGSFTPDLASGGRHVLIAAGSGITPVLSIAASLLQQPAATVTLIYGNRHANTVMFAEELADLKDAHGSRLELVHVLSREPREVELFTGRLDPDRIRRLLQLLVPVSEVDHFWLCGPYALVTGAQDVLRELGVADRQVHAELFYVEELPPPPVHHVEPGVDGPSCELTVVLDGRSTTLTAARDRPVLDSAQLSRSDLPFACKGGVCGTCRAQVVDGSVQMLRNFALEADEVAAGFVLTCQSVPTSDRITVDYDV